MQISNAPCELIVEDEQTLRNLQAEREYFSFALPQIDNRWHKNRRGNWTNLDPGEAIEVRDIKPFSLTCLQFLPHSRWDENSPIQLLQDVQVSNLVEIE
jgi:hypothetical protein